VASAVPGPVFVLVHSPLVGPTSWLPVARELERRGRVAVVPSLLGVAGAAAPQWRHVPEAVRAATARIGEPIVLAGHSGGGLLLPAIADAVAVEVAALVFVDSFLPPTAGWLPLAPPAFMEQLRALAGDGVLAPWSSWFGADAMRDLVGDERLRAALEAEMPRLPLSYYLLLSAEPYRQSATEARARGWPVAEIPGVQHLATATEPVAVTEALLDLERGLDRRVAPWRRQA
jgi:pimeloyl-ACP methyl ester carboxylesterase